MRLLRPGKNDFSLNGESDTVSNLESI